MQTVNKKKKNNTGSGLKCQDSLMYFLIIFFKKNIKHSDMINYMYLTCVNYSLQ